MRIGSSDVSTPGACSTGQTYTTAKSLAASQTFKGQTGYLVTITSSNEEKINTKNCTLKQPSELTNICKIPIIKKADIIDKTSGNLTKTIDWDQKSNVLHEIFVIIDEVWQFHRFSE